MAIYDNELEQNTDAEEDKRMRCGQCHCGHLLEVVDTGGWCANNLGMGPEYPGLQYESELERMNHLACSTRWRGV
jgi:hypothetical protein